MNIATLFSGGEGVSVGGKKAGLQHLWGLDDDDAIAQVARNNGFHIITADVTTANPARFEQPDILHASPPCPNFSQAKTGNEETVEDIALAQATVQFIETLTPHWFTLENVWLYRHSESWRQIQDALNRLGYWTDVQHLNAADFGVPQTRKRMIVRAVLGGFLPPLPPPEPWKGWYQAVEDLLPGLPDSKFAKWQLERGVQDLLDQSRLFSQGISHDQKGNEYPLAGSPINDPAFTITANRNMLGIRAFLCSSQSKDGGAPAITDADNPAFTVGTNANRWRAFLATGQYGQPAGTPDRKCQTVDSDEPSPTVTASTKGDWRVAIPGRIVQMTPRCLARLQSFPDDYLLPESATMATRAIGNAVPPLWYQKILEATIC